MYHKHVVRYIFRPPRLNRQKQPAEVARASDGNLQITPKCLKAAGSNEPPPQFLANQRNVAREPRRTAALTVFGVYRGSEKYG